MKIRIGGNEVQNEKEQKIVRSRIRGVWRMLGLSRPCLRLYNVEKVGSCTFQKQKSLRLCSLEPKAV